MDFQTINIDKFNQANSKLDNLIDLTGTLETNTFVNNELIKIKELLNK